MHRFFKATWFWITLKVLGWGFLAGYLLLSGDWRVSPFWALGVPAVSFFVAWLFVGLKLFDRIPKLNGYLLYSDGDKTRPTAVSSDDWALKQAAYLNAGFRWKAFLSTPAEDGLICVPILLAGIGPLSAMLGGVAFGCLHLARYTYMECIGKSITYAIVCISSFLMACSPSLSVT